MFQVVIEKFSVKQLLYDVRDLMLVKAEEKNIYLKVEVDDLFEDYIN